MGKFRKDYHDNFAAKKGGKCLVLAMIGSGKKSKVIYYDTILRQ